MSDYFCNKDLASKMGLSLRSLQRWKRRLKKKPTVATNAGQRWSERDAQRFLNAWQSYKPKRKRKR